LRGRSAAAAALSIAKDAAIAVRIFSIIDPLCLTRIRRAGAVPPDVRSTRCPTASLLEMP